MMIPSANAASLTWDTTNAADSTITDAAGTWSDGGITWNNGTASVQWTNASSDTAIFSGTAGGAIAIALGSNVTQGGTVFNGTSNYTFANGFVITGTGGITKNGSSTVTLGSGMVSYAGTTTVNGGTLVLTAGTGANSYPAGDLFINGASTLRLTGQRYDFSGKTFTFDSTGGGTLDVLLGGQGSLVFLGNNSFVTNGGAMDTISGSGASQGININTGTAATFNVATGTNATTDLTVSTLLFNTGNVIKTGPGRMAITTAPGYTGTTTVSAGTLSIVGPIGSFPSSGIVNNATMRFATTSGASGVITYGNAISGTGTFTIDTSGTTNGARLQLSGTALNNTNQWNIVNAGTLWLNGAAGTYGTAMNINVSGATDTGAYLSLNGSTNAIFNIGSLAGAGKVTNNSGNSQGLIAGNGNGSSTYSGVMSGAIAFTKTGTGIQTLTGVNTYTGTTTINGGTLQIGGGGSLGSGSYSGAIANTAALEYSSSANQTLSGVISGSGGTLTKDTGSGTLILSNTNTYTGATVVSAGTLAVTGSISNSPTIDVQTGGTLNLASIVSGQTLKGTGTVGTTTVQSGATLSPAGAGTIGTLKTSGTLTMAGEAAFEINKAGTTLTSDSVGGGGAVAFGGHLTISASGDSLTVGDSFTLFSNSGARSGAFATITLPTLDPGLIWNTSTLAADGKITVGTLSVATTPFFNPAPGGYVGAQSVSITADSGATIYYTTDGSTPTTASASGTTTVAGITVPTNTTGFTIKAYAVNSGQSDSPVTTAVYNTITSPVWNVNSDGLWSGASNWLNNVVADGVGASADFTFARTANATVTLDSNRTLGSLTFGNTNHFNWTIAAGGGTLTLDGGAAVPVISVLGDTTTLAVPLAGTNGLTKNGAGALTLSGSSTYTGTTTINAGTLQVGVTSVPGLNGALGVNSPIVFANTAGVLMNLAGFNTQVGSLAGGGTTGGSITLGAGTLTTGADNTTTSYGGGISGTGGVTKVGTGTQTFSGVNSYTGATTINSGTLEVNGGSLTSTGTVNIVNTAGGSGTLRMTGGTVTLTSGGNISVGQDGSLVGNAAYIQTGGTVTANTSNFVYVALCSTAGSTGSFSISGGSFSTTQSLWLGVRNTGTLTVSGSAAVTVGQLRLLNVGSSGTGIVNLDGGTLTTGATDGETLGSTFNFNGGTLILRNAGTNFLLGFSTQTVKAGGALINTQAFDATFAQAIVHDSTLGATADGGLTKSGSGALTLSAIDTYTGPTVVSAGTLMVNGTLSATSSVTAASATTLGGGGTISGPVSVAGTLAPGTTGTGTLATGSLTLTGTYACQINGSASDNVTVNGDLDLTGATLTVTEITPKSQPSYVIATYTGTLTGTFASVPSGYTVDYSTAGLVSLIPNGYAAWAAGFPGLTDSSPGADPDNDGLSNLLEYVLGGDPRVSDASIRPVSTIVGSNLVLTYKRSDASKGDTFQEGQWSTDLINWFDVDPVIVNANGTAPDDMSVTVPMSNAVDGKLFLRLHVTQ